MCGVCALCPAKFTGVTGVFFANSTVLLYRNYTGNNCQIPPFCSSRTTQVTQCGCEAGWTGQSCDVAANKFTVTLPAQAPQDFSGPYRASSAYGTDNMLFTKVTADHANNTYTVRKADDGWEMVFAVRHCMPLPEMQCEGNDLHPPAGNATSPPPPGPPTPPPPGPPPGPAPTCAEAMLAACDAMRKVGKKVCQLCTYPRTMCMQYFYVELCMYISMYMSCHICAARIRHGRARSQVAGCALHRGTGSCVL